MKRRANGLGTAYKLTGNRARPWVARFPAGRDEFGRRKWVTLGYYKTKSEAEKALKTVHDFWFPLSLNNSNNSRSKLYEQGALVLTESLYI